LTKAGLPNPCADPDRWCLLRCAVQGKSTEGAPVVTVNADRNVFGFGCGLLEIIERASKEFIPLYKDDKVPPQLPATADVLEVLCSTAV
jgi:hypothetical protein